MARKIISKEELIKWMNQKLHAEEDFENCRFTSVYKLVDMDDSGCNWDLDKMRCSGIPFEACKSSANVVVRKAKALFNKK